MPHLKKTLTFAGAALALTAPLVASVSPAYAAGRDGVCDSGEFCYYYNSNEAGSISDFTTSIGDYGTTQPSCYDFKSAGSGQGVCVKNNAASVWNRTSHTVRVYYNSNYGGAYQDFAAGAKGNLNATLKNNNASHQILDGSGQTPRNDYDGNARGFAQNNCTAFAAWRIASRLGVPNFSNSWKTTWGNAGTWDDAARRVGVTVNKTPSVGAIAVNDVHKVGHVAYVNRVYSDGSFDVEEYNWNNPLAYGTRSHVHVSTAQADFQWMLHF
ncbi:CHAP domain-containing protein [Actinomadura montaniterrae]|uniref:CHAP domain-containing protein n=1 Tax=Actinomadura montaniterrae TaxID=1803903 RepID=A0A6L3VPU6_9ACTN|nr:CHAP domain-containing protein [Actinomadura montaniterrae]KAB2368154.1 CHAP domain-containing protein [Actinomadura montaniterrae]